MIDFSTPIIGLSPMDGITDAAYRLTQCQIAKPDIVFTEFVSAEGLAHSAVKLLDHLLYSPLERPIIGQLFGKDPDSFYFSTLLLCHLGFDGIDINMGCPAKTVTQHGSGAALIDQPTLAGQIISSCRRAIDDFQRQKASIAKFKLKIKFLSRLDELLLYSRYTHQANYSPSLSVKTRLGTFEINHSWLPFLSQQPLDFVTLHGRTLRQGYAGQADWSAIAHSADIFHQAGKKIFGNGDIQSRQQGIEYCQKFAVDGVLIGRSSLGNPWVFADTLNSNWSDHFQAFKDNADNFVRLFPDRRLDCLKNQGLAYTRFHPRAKELRQKIIHLESIADIYSLEADFINC